MSVEDYCPEVDNDYDEYEEDIKKNDMKIKQLSILKTLFEDGGLRTENILEIQMILKLIDDCDNENKLQMGKCLELIINLANQYLHALHENGSI